MDGENKMMPVARHYDLIVVSQSLLEPKPDLRSPPCTTQLGRLSFPSAHLTLLVVGSEEALCAAL